MGHGEEIHNILPLLLGGFALYLAAAFIFALSALLYEKRDSIQFLWWALRG